MTPFWLSEALNPDTSVRSISLGADGVRHTWSVWFDVEKPSEGFDCGLMGPHAERGLTAYPSRWLADLVREAVAASLWMLPEIGRDGIRSGFFIGSNPQQAASCYRVYRRAGFARCASREPDCVEWWLRPEALPMPEAPLDPRGMLRNPRKEKRCGGA